MSKFSKDARQSGRKHRGFGMFNDIPNPIPAEIEDAEDIKKAFKEYGFMPYAGTSHNSRHGLLSWLNSMSQLSPTHGSCINSIKTYAFGNSLEVFKEKSTSFYSKKDDTTEEQKESFITWLDELLQFDHSKNLYTEVLGAYKQFSDNGNIFLEVKLTNILGVNKASFTLHDTEHVCYTWDAKIKKNRFVGISTNWDYTHIRQFPPRILPVWPNYTFDGNTVSTMIHVKTEGTTLYGRPHWMNAFMQVYREFQDANYLIKQAANNFTAQTLIEIEDAEAGDPAGLLDDEDAQKGGFENAAERFQENFSAGADNPQSVLLLSRPYGAKEAFVFQFKPNTNETFYKTMSELDELDIIRAHQWSKRFLGENQTQGFSKDVFLDELKVKEVAVLPYYRKFACEAFNIAIDMMVEFFGKPEFKGFRITGQNSIDVLKKIIPDEDLTEGVRVGQDGAGQSQLPAEQGGEPSQS